MQWGSDSLEGAALKLATVSFKMQKSADGIVAQRHSESYGHGEGLNPSKEVVYLVLPCEVVRLRELFNGGISVASLSR